MYSACLSYRVGETLLKMTISEQIVKDYQLLEVKVSGRMRVKRRAFRAKLSSARTPTPHTTSDI